VEDVEFRLGPGMRVRQLWTGGIALVVAIVLVVVTLHANIALRWLFVIPLVVAVCGLTGYVLRGRFRTRLTARGIETQGFIHRFVPWESVREVESYTFERAGEVAVVGARIQGRYSSQEKPRRKVAVVQIVRDNGRRVELPAPLDSDYQHDPDFDDKVQQIREHWRAARQAGPDREVKRRSG
jgi:hypothetical protein